MKPIGQRNPALAGVIGVLIVGGGVAAAFNYDTLPFMTGGTTYSAYFADAGGLTGGAEVQVSGYRAGQVSSIDLNGDEVMVTFHIDSKVRLGDRTEAAIKTKSVLGAKILEITPRGDGPASGPIPMDRTTSPYQLPDALGDLTATISGLNTDQLSNSLATLSQTFTDTPPDVKVAVQGVQRLSAVIDSRDAQLRNLLANANKVTTVLAQRSDQIVSFIIDTNSLLVQLQTQSRSLDQLFGNLSALSRQLSGFVAENRQPLKPALEKVNGVLTVLDNRKERIQKAIKLLNSYAMSLGEALASGPFFKAYLANLLPGQFLQPFIDAAFSDLGLDPNVLAPSQLSDPQTGQPGTPALPVPYPRTGQGGEPRMTLPDAITGNPGDQGCGPPGLPLPGPSGCYPYREPEPAPPPGGPPPGPPGPAPLGQESVPEPTPRPVYVPAPGEQPTAASTAGGGR